MAKKGVYKISGNTKPKVGEKTFYTVQQWYPETSSSDRDPAKVTWELFVKGDNGFVSTNIKKKGINHFTFGVKAHQFTYKIEGYLYKPEGNAPMSLIVQPQKNEEPPKQKEKDILGVSLTYEDGSKISKTLSYRDRLKATAKCEGMEGKKVVFTLWEDDTEKEGHNKNNQYITKSPPIEVNKYGKAIWIFPLSPTFISLANKREDDKKKHEYYVTAEYNGKLNASNNVNANNPDYKPPVPKALPKAPTKPRTDSPKTSTKPASKNNQADKKGVIKSLKLADKDGKAFTKCPKFGETIMVIIDAQNVKGLQYNLRLWEDDNVGKDDLLYNEIHTFKNDLQYVLIPLSSAMQKTGEIGNDSNKPDRGEYAITGNHQEIFVEVVFSHTSSKSQIIDVGLNEKPKKQQNGKAPIIVNKTEKAKTPSTTCLCKQYNLIWGQKVSCDFRKKVVAICKDLWGDENKIKMANNLMAIFQWESGGTFKPDAPNQANSGGTGLIQFTPKTARYLLGKEITIETVKNYYGKKYNEKTKQKEDWNLDRVKEFADMTAITQLKYVKEHFESLRGKNVEFIDLYLQVLFPASSGLPEHVVFADNLNKLDRPFEKEKLRNERVAAYSKNSGMDLKKDGKLMKSEIKVSVQKYITEGMAHAAIEKCENKVDEKAATLTGKCTEGTVVGGFIENHLVTKNKIENCNKNSMTKKVAIVVLHRTAGGAAIGTLTHMKNEGYGAHFVIDYNGTVYQTIGLDKRGSHMGKAPFQSTINAGWGNANSIAIETCGYSLDKDGNKRVGKKYDKIPHHHWEPVTDLQAKSVACLLKFLLNNFNLTIGDVKVHEKLCNKEPKEGQDVYDSMLPYFNSK